MLTDDRASNLLFLLTLPLAIGCATGDEDTTSTSLPPVVNPTNGSDFDTGTGTSEGGQDGNTSSSNPSTSSADGPSMTTQPADDTSDGPYSDSGYATGYDTGYATAGYSCGELMPPMVAGPISPTCMQYGALANECYFGGDPACLGAMEAYCQYSIEYGTNAYGPNCGMAYEELYACLSQLSCQQLGDKTEDCPQQFSLIQMACGM
jgi:hypothetical protein